MRSVLVGDVLAVLRAMLAVPPEAREPLCAEIFARAERADRAARNKGRRRTALGCGTLAGAADAYAAVEVIDLDDPAHCACLELIAQRLRYRPRHQHL